MNNKTKLPRKLKKKFQRLILASVGGAWKLSNLKRFAVTKDYRHADKVVSFGRYSVTMTQLS
jgi:hypothetical protein